MSEHDEQSTVVAWFKRQYPQYSLCIMANVNGAILCDLPEKKRFMRMAYLKKEGFKKGVSDLQITVPRGGKHGLWVEMKDRGKTPSSVSKEQSDHLDLMIRMGYEGIWAAGADIAIAAIKVYMAGTSDHNRDTNQPN